VDPRYTAVDITTNGAELPRDMANRLNPCRLRKQEGDYKFQSFPEGDLLEHVTANQPRYLGALYAILREWLRRGAPLAEGAGGHDFRKWARAVRWICMELLGIGDPMADLVEIKQRLASPGGSWLREACLALKRLGHVGTSMTPMQVAKALAGYVPVPGIAADEDLEDEMVALKAARAVGSRLGGCFRSVEADGPEQRLRVEDLVLVRISVADEADSSKVARLYRLEKHEPPF
jgi:hypothetical protein